MQKLQIKFKLSLRSTMTSALVILSFLQLTACGTNAAKKESLGSTNATAVELVQKKSNEISVMTFNVENLFDLVHDKDREDFTFLPLSEKAKPEAKAFCAQQKSWYRQECEELDWNSDVLNAKMKNISKVIRHIDGGKGPDNILMSEVENQSVLTDLVKKELSDLGYQTIVLIEGPDLRGIDPAILSKFPLVGKPKLHLIPYVDSNPEQLKWARRSRGIIEATVKLPNNKNLTLMAAHFPSQSNPTAWRAQAVQFAKKLMAEHQAQGRAVIFGGDLNIIVKEEENEGYFKKELSQVGQVSHLVGCKHCEGSHNYRGEWSFLDVMVFSNNLKQAAKVELLTESLIIVKSPVHMKRNGTPLRFEASNKEGVSDHFPLYARLKMLD